MTASKLLTLNEAKESGLLKIADNVRVELDVRFCFTDFENKTLPIEIGSNVFVDYGSVLYGGVHLLENVIIESSSVIGRPEFGYALQNNYKGELFPTIIGSNSIIRSSAIIYSGVDIGENTTVGHFSLIRSFVKIGNNTQIAHYNSIEREVVIGNNVRMSPQSHITASTIMEDRVFIGAGVKTINDKSMIWDKNRLKPSLNPPVFRKGCKIGSGSTIGSGVIVGENSMVGSASLVLNSIPDNCTAYGHPAAIKEK